MLLRNALVRDRVIEDVCLLGFVLWRDNDMCLCAYVVLLFVRKADKTRFVVNRSIYGRCIMAFLLYLNIKGWLNVAHMLLSADYIGI